MQTLHKKKTCSRYQSCNYRPVSFPSQACKLFERLLEDCITSQLDNYDLLNKSQHGFMKAKSCLNNRFEFLEDVTDILDKGEQVDVIYLDFANAFDMVPRYSLLALMEMCYTGLRIGLVV